MYTQSLKYIEHGIVVYVSPGKCLCLRNQHMRRKAAGSRRMHEAGKQKLFCGSFDNFCMLYDYYYPFPLHSKFLFGCYQFTLLFCGF